MVSGIMTPGIPYRELIIVGARNPKTHRALTAIIRAFDVRSGASRWNFHTSPSRRRLRGLAERCMAVSGAANNWTRMAAVTLNGYRAVSRLRCRRIATPRRFATRRNLARSVLPQ